MADGHVLVIEDDQAVFDTIRVVLQRGGFEAIAVRDAASVMRELASRAPVAALLNAQLRTDSAVGILIAIRQRDPALPVIAIAPDVIGSDHRRQLEQHGISDFVFGPLDDDRLLARLAKTAGGASGRRDHRFHVAARVGVQFDEDGDFADYDLSDVSSEGMFICIDAPPPPKTRLRVCIDVPEIGGVVLDARVAHSIPPELAATRRSAPGMGIKLVGLGEDERDAFEQFARHSRRRAPAPSVRPQARQRRASREEIQMRNVLRSQLTWLRDSTFDERLGVAAGADRLTIQRAYIALAAKYQPDQYRGYSDRKIHEQARQVLALLAEAEQALMADAELPPPSQAGAGPSASGTYSRPPSSRRTGAGRGSVAGPDSSPGAGPISSRGMSRPPHDPSHGRVSRSPRATPVRTSHPGAAPPSRPSRQSAARGPAVATHADRRSSSPAAPSLPPDADGPPSVRPSMPGSPQEDAPPMSVDVARADTYYERGMVAVEQGRLPDARNLFQQAYKTAPGPRYEAAVELVKGLVAKSDQRLEDARAHFKRATRLDAGVPHAKEAIRALQDDKPQSALRRLFRR